MSNREHIRIKPWFGDKLFSVERYDCMPDELMVAIWVEAVDEEFDCTDLEVDLCTETGEILKTYAVDVEIVRKYTATLKDEFERLKSERR